MKNRLLASPLYILRKECAVDLFAVLSELGKMSFDGVEFLGFFGRTPEEVRSRMEELDMIPLGNHVGIAEFISDLSGTIGFHKKVGCRYITVGGIPQSGLPGGEKFSETVRDLTRIGRACREEGITLLYHNHGFELAHRIQDKYMLEIILDEVSEEFLALEPDLGWMAIGGADPAYFLEKYQNRCPVIHFKDFYASDISKIGNPGDLDNRRGTADRGYFEFRPVGYGIMNIPQYMRKVLACDPEWIVMDHDLAYERSSLEDLQLSLSYVRRLLEMI